MPNEVDNELKANIKIFLKKVESEMQFSSNYVGDLLSFEWLDEISYACPFIDNVIRKPKIALIQEENVVKIEKSKRINVSSVKDLSRHTEYINKHNKKTDEIEPEKILDIRNEETFNTYENRFLYTLYKQLTRFVMRKEKELSNFEISDDKSLEYVSNSKTNKEKVHVELKINSISLPTDKVDKKLLEQIEDAKVRIKKIRDYLSSWDKSEMIKALTKANVPLINPPIKKTNVILKNPNFRIAATLWEYLNKYDDKEDIKEASDSNGNDVLKGFLDHSFLIDYLVLDSINASQREQKKKIAKRAIILLTEEIHRIISLLIGMGMNVDEEQLLSMIAKEIKNEKSERLVGEDDVKKKFKNAMEEYLERIQDNL